MSYMKKVLVICEQLVQIYAERPLGYWDTWVGNPELTKAKQASAKEFCANLEKLRGQTSITYMDTSSQPARTVKVVLDSDEKIYQAAKNIVICETFNVQRIKEKHAWGTDGDYDKLLQIIQDILIKSFAVVKTSELENMSDQELAQDPRAIFVGALTEYIIRLELDELADKQGLAKSWGTDYKIGSGYWTLNDLTNQLKGATRTEIAKVNRNYRQLKCEAGIIDKINEIKPLIRSFQLEEQSLRKSESKKSYTSFLGGHKDGRLTSLVKEALANVERLVEHRFGKEQMMALLQEQHRDESRRAQLEKYGRVIYEEYNFGNGQILDQYATQKGMPVPQSNPFEPTSFISDMSNPLLDDAERFVPMGNTSRSSSTSPLKERGLSVAVPEPKRGPMTDLAAQLNQLVVNSESGAKSGEEEKDAAQEPMLFSAQLSTTLDLDVEDQGELDSEEKFATSALSSATESESEEMKRTPSSY